MTADLVTRGCDGKSCSFVRLLAPETWSRFEYVDCVARAANFEFGEETHAPNTASAA